MKRVGVRELLRRARVILRRVETGETVEVSDQGRHVEVIVKPTPRGLDALEREGLLRRAEGDLLDVTPVPYPAGSTAPSRNVNESREE